MEAFFVLAERTYMPPTVCEIARGLRQLGLVKALRIKKIQIHKIMGKGTKLS
jgi:hypothetical protein